MQELEIRERPLARADATIALSLHGVNKTFHAKPAPVHALRGVDLTVETGSFTAILGASGCGKTTLLRLIAGFDRLDSGEIQLDGRVLSAPGMHVAPERRRMGIVPQEGALFPHLSVARNVGFGLATWPVRSLSPRVRRARAARVLEMLELVGLPDYAERRPDELSGGQQQRVALARALAPNPDVVLLDEPFSALDAGLRAELRDEVRELLARLGTTTILVTHDQEEALSLADAVAVMRDGRVVQSGSPQEIYVTPSDQQIAEFIGDVIFLRGRLVSQPAVDGPCAECELGQLAVRLNNRGASSSGQCMVMLRPEQIEIAEQGTPARVINTRFFGHDGIVRLRLGADGTGAQVLVRTQGDQLPANGDLVCVRIAGDRIRYQAAPAFHVAS